MVKACVCPGLDHLSGRNQPLHNFAADRRQHRNLGGRRAVCQVLRIFDSQDLHALLGGVAIRLRLRPVGLRLLQIALGNGVVIVQIFGARVVFVGKAERVVGFQIGVQQLRIVGAGHLQHGLALVHMLARHDQNAGHRAAHLGDHRRGFETRCRQPRQSAAAFWSAWWVER